MEAVTFPLPGDCSRRQRLLSGNQRVQGRPRHFFHCWTSYRKHHIFPNYFFPKSSAWAAHNLCPQHWCRKMCLYIYYYPPNTHTPQREPVLGSPGAILQLRDSPSWKLHRGSLPWSTGKRMVGCKGSFQKAQRTLWFCDGSTPGTLSLEGNHSCGLTT